MEFEINTEIATNLDKRSKLQVKLDEAKLLNIIRLVKILIETYGFDKFYRGIVDKEGKDIEFYFPALEGYLTFSFVKSKFEFEPQTGRVTSISLYNRKY